MLLDNVADLSVGSIVKLKLKGKTCNRWIDANYTETANLEFKESENVGRYYYPVFKSVDITQLEMEEADDADVKLQEYFSGKHTVTEEEDDIPF